MANLTFERVQILKNYRIKNNIKSKDIVEKIGTSNAYVSKLEKGDYKTIDDKMLNKIIETIATDIEEQKEILEAFNDSIEFNLVQQIKNTLLKTESYILDFNNLTKIIEDSISVNEETQKLLLQNAKTQVDTYKKILHELIDKINLD